MAETKFDDLVMASPPPQPPDGSPAPKPDAQPSTAQPATQPEPWPTFLRQASDSDVSRRFASEMGQLLNQHLQITNAYCCIGLLDPETGIGQYDLDRVFEALTDETPNREKDVLLVLLSSGGQIEPAYQMSRVCKQFSKNRFVVAVPRHAKSAATLLALGADEIHIGPLGQLGPIDPQLGRLPALAVSQALATIADLTERHPGSSEMFASYLRQVLTVEQIGYCERICESAAQYAERLLFHKQNLPRLPAEIAQELVREYKDHGFVIDLAEATDHLGSALVKTGTPELAFAELIYRQFDLVNMFLGFIQKKRLLVVGRLDKDPLVFERRR